MNKTLLLAVVALAVAAVVVIAVQKNNPAGPDESPSPSTSGRACTMEAKICPDGSAVGRVGPNCEFAPCPTPRQTPVGTPVPIY